MSYAWQPPWRRDYQLHRGGGGGGGAQMTGSQVILPAWVEAQGQANLARAQGIADRPYEANPNATVAPMTADQTAAYNTIRGMQGQTAPGFAAAEGAAAGMLPSVHPITTGQINTDTQGLLDPYMTAVVDPTVAQMRTDLEQQIRQIGANAGNVGAYGGDRQAIEVGTARAREALGEGQLVGGLLSSGYNTAQERAAALGAGNLAAGEWGATTLPGLLTQGAGETAREASLLEQAGRAQQGQSQAEIDQAAQNWLDQWNYPIEGLSLLESTLGASPYGQTTISRGPAPQGQSAAGLAIGGVGAAAGVIGAVAAL